ncbi:hypothetical protein ABVK25_006534 [Lepraria finkii]|uniref:Protein kinase domain-containing protein n=1 Tax=Lepraria finkii TaxID=1340010 RepID=A0ABR4B8L7_9LECA
MATDMWSFDAVTTAIYLGRSPFNDYEDQAFTDDEILKNAVKCDLEFLDHSSFWHGIDHRSRDFIKKLLLLDETKRLNVGQALDHEWFTDSDQKKLLDEKNQQEDLRKIMAIRRLKTDSQLTPPPPKSNLRSSGLPPLIEVNSNEESSPYFAMP